MTPEAPETRSAFDRRLSPRVAANIPVQLHVKDQSVPLDARCRDIGTGGACVATSCHVALDTLQRVVLRFPNNPVSLRVEGRWQREVSGKPSFLTGMRFSLPTAETTFLLWQFVQERGQELARFLHERSELTTLDLEEHQQVALFSRLREVPAGSRIFSQHSEAPGSDSIFVVFRGSVVLQAEAGKRGTFEIRRLGEGAVFGGLPLAAGTPQVETTLAATDTLLLELDAFSFHYLEVAQPALVRRMLRSVMRTHILHLQELVHRVADDVVIEPPV